MSTDERDESLSRPTKGTPGVRRENTEMDGERRSFNQGYNRSEGYEHRSYNRDYNNNGGGYRSYGDNNNRSSYSDRQGRSRYYDNNRDGGFSGRSNYGNNGRGNYGNNRGGYDNRSNYGNAGGQGIVQTRTITMSHNVR